MPHDSDWHFGFDKPGWLRDNLDGLNWDPGGWAVWDIWLFDWHIATLYLPPFGFYPGAWIENGIDVIGWLAADWLNFALDRIRDIHGFTDAAYSWIQDIWRQLGDVWQWIVAAVSWVWDQISQWWSGVWSGVQGFIELSLAWWRDAIETWLRPVTDWFNNTKPALDDFLSDPWTFLQAKVAQAILDALNGWALLFDATRTWYDDHSGILQEFTNNPADFVGDRIEAWVEDKTERVTNFVIRMLDKVW